MNSDQLALSVKHADGTITRWGPDEVDAANIAGGLRFGTSIPGGNKSLTCSLLRAIDVTYNDQALFDDARAYGPGGRTAWNGRMVQFPRSQGQGFSITPGAVGYAAHLRDDPSFGMVYIDLDLSTWQNLSTQRRLDLLALDFAL